MVDDDGGVAAEFGVIMLLYLEQALDQRHARGKALTLEAVKDAIIEGAVLRVRPKAMTVAVILAGLLPIMLGSGTGSEIMRRIAAPMVGGMISSTILTLVVIPAVYALVRERELARTPLVVGRGGITEVSPVFGRAVGESNRPLER